MVLPHPDFRASTLSVFKPPRAKGLKALLLSLLLYHPFSLADTVITVFLILVPLSLQDLDSETGVHRVVAGEMAVGVPSEDLVAAMIGNLFEVAHNVALCNQLN